MKIILKENESLVIEFEGVEIAFHKPALIGIRFAENQVVVRTDLNGGEIKEIFKAEFIPV